MTKRKSPHTSTQQNVRPALSDLEPNQQQYESGRDEGTYDEMNGAQTGVGRSARNMRTTSVRHNTEPELEAHEGSVTSRTPKGPGQGITAHSAQEESERQEKVVKDRPDAQAGVNHSNKRRA